MKSQFTPNKSMRAGTLFILCLLLSNHASAQEVGALVSQSWSDNPEMESPFGFGIYLSSDPSSFVFGISYERLSDSRTYEGYSTVFSPVSIWEPITSSVRADVVKLHSSWFPLLYDHFSFGIGAALSTNWLSISKTGLQTGNHVPTEDAHKFGAGLSLLARIIPITSLPAVITIKAERHVLTESTSGVTDVQKPFLESIAMTSISLAIGYSF